MLATALAFRTGQRPQGIVKNRRRPVVSCGLRVLTRLVPIRSGRQEAVALTATFWYHGSHEKNHLAAERAVVDGRNLRRRRRPFCAGGGIKGTGAYIDEKGRFW